MLIRGLPFHLACLPKISKSLILGDILSLYVAVIGVKAVNAVKASEGVLPTLFGYYLLDSF